jgi:hypothetical protein
MTKKELTIIGTTDRIDLPALGLFDLECKIDTGADTSTIHCSKVRVVEKDGVEWLKFRVLDKEHPQFNRVNHLVKDFSEKTVRSSNGETETRYVIRTKAVLFGRIFPITFTLSHRGKMKYPVLIGKKFLRNRFLVDVTQKDLSFQKKEKVSP